MRKPSRDATVDDLTPEQEALLDQTVADLVERGTPPGMAGEQALFMLGYWAGDVVTYDDAGNIIDDEGATP